MKKLQLLSSIVGVCMILTQANLAQGNELFDTKPIAVTGTDGAAEFLHVDEAFRPDLLLLPGNRIQVEWLIADSYYLYKHRFKFEAINGVSLGPAQIPGGEKKSDEFFGEVEVYHRLVSITIPFQATEKDFTITIGYQGCAEAGLCYPPETKAYQVDTVSGEISALSKAELKSQRTKLERKNSNDGALVLVRNNTTEEGSLAATIADETLWMMRSLFFAAGGGLAFTPC